MQTNRIEEQGAANMEPYRMRALCYENGRLVAIEDVDLMANPEFKLCMDVQREMGREVRFQLVW